MVEKTYMIRNLFEDSITEGNIDNDKVISQMNDKLSIEKVGNTWVAISKLRKEYIKQLIKESIKEFWKENKPKPKHKRK